MALITAAAAHNGECHVVVLTGVGVNLSSTISSVYYRIPNRSCPASMRVEVIINQIIFFVIPSFTFSLLFCNL
jgi:hypothetical protein